MFNRAYSIALSIANLQLILFLKLSESSSYGIGSILDQSPIQKLLCTHVQYLERIHRFTLPLHYWWANFRHTTLAAYKLPLTPF